MEDFEILILIFNIITFAIAVGACILYSNLELQHNCTRCRLYDAEEEIEKLKAEIDFLKKNND
ncbi:hypothetical protein [Parasutterella excrementihominis]|jgi:hypothetical protein|uniref:Cell division protein n=1 Tax=Siphoviridae sp. ctRg81 TaxID=2826336 RepID=A0A8S5NHY5_9CAUD|nr:MAG TPA: cell division protein [Siphoviridae sp. ctRg81]